MPTEKQTANLIPNSQRTPSELREMARKGGIKSGETRRERKSLKETVKTLLDLPLSLEDKKKLTEKLKLTGKLTQREAVAFALLNEARKGKPQQARLILEMDDSIGSSVALLQQQQNNRMEINVICHNPQTQELLNKMISHFDDEEETTEYEDIL